MSIVSTNKEIISIKNQIKQLSDGIPTFDGSLYSQVGHTHSTGQITGLDTALSGKASTTHTHSTGQITGLDTALSGKASTTHTHTTGQITGLDTALSGKASAIHTHAIEDINNLTTTLSNKQDKLTAGTNISFNGNIINSLNASQWTSGSGGIIYYNSGNVGIGTASPDGKLEVIGNIVLQNKTDTWQTVFQMYNNDKSKNCSFNLGGTTNNVIGNGSLGIFMNNDFRMTIKDDGNVGIAKTNPAYKLDVSGDINYTGELRKIGVVQNTLSKHVTFTEYLTIATHYLALSTFFTGGNIISGVYNLSICDNDLDFETTQYCIGTLVVWDSKIVTIVVHKRFTLDISWNTTSIIITNNGGKPTLFRKTLSRVNDF